MQSINLHLMCAKSRSGYGELRGTNVSIRRFINDRYREYGATLTEEDYNAARRQIDQHNAWFQKHIVDEDTIMILPRYSLDYRDEYLP